MPKSCDTITSTLNAARSKKKWWYYEHDCPSTMRPSTAVGIGSRQVESPTRSETYRGGPTFPYAMGSSWGGTLEAALEGSLGRESQSDERVMSLPKHMVKLPYWSSEWYRWFHREVARHVTVLLLHKDSVYLVTIKRDLVQVERIERGVATQA